MGKLGIPVLFFQPKTHGTSIQLHPHFVQSKDQYLTLFFISYSSVFISHLARLLLTLTVHVCCFTLTLRKNLLGSKRKANNIYFDYNYLYLSDALLTKTSAIYSESTAIHGGRPKYVCYNRQTSASN